MFIWYVDEFSFKQSSLQGFYLVRNLELPGQLSKDGLIISYFDETILGYRQWYGEFTDVPVMGKDNNIGTQMYISEGQIPNFKYFDPNSGQLYDLLAEEEIPSWTANNYFVLEKLMLVEAEINSPYIHPDQIELFAVYPNPFNPVCNLRIEIIEDSNFRLHIYDMNGKLIEELANTQLNVGNHVFTWNAEHSPSGIYLARLESPTEIYTKKLLLLK